MRASFGTLAPKRSDDQARVYVASTAPSTLEVFVARAEARAILHVAGELTLHEAVDELQATAERDGLVAEMGQDEVQQVMAEAFAAVFTDPREAGEENSAVSENDSDISGGVGESAGNPTPLDVFAALCREADETERGKPVNLCIERAHRLLEEDVSLERAPHEINARPERAAEATVEALTFSLRHGIYALSQLDTLRRLSELDDAQLRAVVIRLLKIKPKIAQPWTPEQVEILLAARSKIR